LAKWSTLDKKVHASMITPIKPLTKSLIMIEQVQISVTEKVYTKFLAILAQQS
jgi:hypothetical protein